MHSPLRMCSEAGGWLSSFLPIGFCRELLVADWLKFLRERGVPMSPGLSDPLKCLVDDAVVAGWVREGLPSDPTSVQNGAILTNSGRDGVMMFAGCGSWSEDRACTAQRRGEQQAPWLQATLRVATCCPVTVC
jgi:hypothetical protein